jgi:hypothetical protein
LPRYIFLLVKAKKESIKMAIDLETENLLTFKQVAAIVPPRRKGRPCNLATVYRWSVAGIRGIRLESVCFGGSRMTSREALHRFIAAVTKKADAEGRLTLANKPAVHRAKKVAAARTRLQRAGM